MNQLSLTLEPPKARTRARRTDPETSHKAAKNAELFVPSHSLRIEWALELHGDLTAKEIAERTGMTVVQVCRRLPEASRFKVVTKDGQPVERDGFRVWGLA